MKSFNPKYQNGIALLLFLIVLIAIAGGVGAKILSDKVETANQDKTIQDFLVLKEARQALLSYAVRYSIDGKLEEMGQLPCPDLRIAANPEGTQDNGCGARYENSIGLLPWKTLGIETLKDSAGECLWYVVSGDYKRDPGADMLNEDSNGLLRIQDENGQPYHGANPGYRPIAFIIAPGKILKSQNRTPAHPSMAYCKGNYTEANYIESGGSVNYATDHVNTADAIWTYVYGSQSSRLENSDFNDKIVWISKKDYWNAIKAQGDLVASVVGSPIDQLTSALALCIANYGNDPNNEQNWLPWPAAIDFTDYRKDDDNGVSNEYKDQNNPVSLIGRLPQDITISDTAENTNSGTPTVAYADTTDIFNTCLTADQRKLWKNWKDHFLYVVSPDFEMLDGIVTALASSCNSIADCITVDGGPVSDDFAAMVFYSNSVSTMQSRNSEPVDFDEKNVLANYLGPENSDLDLDYLTTDGDLAYCIQVVANAFVVTDCS